MNRSPLIGEEVYAPVGLLYGPCGLATVVAVDEQNLTATVDFAGNGMPDGVTVPTSFLNEVRTYDAFRATTAESRADCDDESCDCDAGDGLALTLRDCARLLARIAEGDTDSLTVAYATALRANGVLRGIGCSVDDLPACPTCGDDFSHVPCPECERTK